MKQYILFILSFFLWHSSGYSQADLENKIKKEFQLNYDLNILEDPISVRNLFLKNQNLVSNYITFVLNADRSWYYNYFNLNSMRRYGWNSYSQMYDNRFLIWNKWRDDFLILPFGDYEWFKPKSKYFFGSNYYTELHYYSIRLASENSYINRQLLLLGKNDIELADVENLDGNKNSKTPVVRDDILTVLVKNGKKFKIVALPGRRNSWIRSNSKYRSRNVSNGGIRDTRVYKGLDNSNSGYSSYDNSSKNLVPAVTRSLVSVGGSTSANAVGSSGGGSTSVVSTGRKQ